MVASRYDLQGVSGSVEFGKGAARVTATGAFLQVQDNAAAAFTNMRGAAPIIGDDFATKGYVDGLVNGASWKSPARVATVSNVTIAAPGASLDGIAMVAGDRFLALVQTVPAQEGLWVWNGAAVPATRPADYASASVQNAPAAFVEEGTQADKAYVGTADPITVDTTSPVFVNFASVTAGVTSISSVDNGGGAGTFASLVASGTAPTPTIRSISNGTQIAAVVSTNEVALSIVALSVGTAELANNSVTEAKLGTGVIVTRRLAFTFGTSSPALIGASIPLGAVILRSRVNVTTPFSPGATLLVGTSGTPGQLQAATDNNPQANGIYDIANEVSLAALTAYQLTIAGSPAAGVGTTTIEFVTP